MKKLFGWLLVIMQFSLIGVFFIRLNPQKLSWVSIILMSFGILLAVWSVWVMKKSRLRILPDPSANAMLVTDGPYKLIRHPMYSSIMLFCAGMNHWSELIDFILYASLFGTLMVKLVFEEHMLKQRFANYSQYQDKTYRLIPFCL